MLNQDWNIQPRGSECCKCRAVFADRQPYISRLDFGKEGYGRLDFCAQCWASRGENDPAVSVWRGIYKAPAPPPEETMKKETVESLLRRIMEKDDSQTNVIFILAAMLERRRVFVERDVKQQPDGSRIRVYEHRKTGESFTVKDPMLRMDQIEGVQQEVMAMLDNNQ